MKRPKVDTSGTEAANKAIADAQLAATNLRTNMAADITTENVAEVVAGGSADSFAISPQGRKRRGTPGNIATQLGIRV